MTLFVVLEKACTKQNILNFTTSNCTRTDTRMLFPALTAKNEFYATG